MTKFILLLGLMVLLFSPCIALQRQKIDQKLIIRYLISQNVYKELSINQQKKTGSLFPSPYGMWIRYGKRMDQSNFID